MNIDNLIARHAGDILDVVCRYLGALTWFDQLSVPVDASGPISKRYDVQPRFVTGFFVEHDQVAYFVTAGHIISEISRASQYGREIIKAQFLTGLHKRPEADWTPIPKDAVRGWWMDDREMGYDIGIVPIPAHFARLLEAANVGFIESSSWSTPDEHFDAYVMVGFPKQESKATPSYVYGGGVGHFNIGTPLLRVSPVNNVSAKLVDGPHRFYGKIESLVTHDGAREIELKDIDGMSGGPVFGIRQVPGGLEYRLVAVQGAWDPLLSIVAASRVHPLLPALIGGFAKQELAG